MQLEGIHSHKPRKFRAMPDKETTTKQSLSLTPQTCKHALEGRGLVISRGAQVDSLGYQYGCDGKVKFRTPLVIFPEKVVEASATLGL